jgi:hypothetical protein
VSPARRTRVRLALGGLVACALSACDASAPEPRLLRLRQATPEPGASGVFLNEAVELFFSEDVDVASVHAQSARIVGPGGATARGRWEVDGRRLRFTPDPVLAADLSDGGYALGATYRVQLAGFPWPDGLRGTSGAPLDQALSWEFHTVQRDGPGRGDVFADSSLERGLPLYLLSRDVLPLGPILLECEEPLDPSTLFGADFKLQGGAGGAVVPLRARLVENFDKRASRPRGTALVELLPERKLELGSYQIYVPFEGRLRDFGGHRVPLLARPGTSGLRIEVVADAVQSGNRHLENFQNDTNRSPEPVPGAEGSASWSGNGRVELRLPAAMGDGRDGTLQLEGKLATRDLQAVRARIPPGVEVELSEQPGLVVIRCQGSLRIEGSLVRREPEGPACDFLPGESLSQWLARASSEGRTATVLIVGGDLVLSGKLEVNGSLLLAAGGRLRLGEFTGIHATDMYVLGENARDRPSFINPKLDQVKNALPDLLALDLASSNLLVEPLTFAVRSGPIPRQGRARRWHALAEDPEQPFGHQSPLPDKPSDPPPVGRYQVRFVGSPPGLRGEKRTEVIVEDPVQLNDSPSLRLQIELTVLPGATWDPPWVDYVEVAWDPAGAEPPR